MGSILNKQTKIRLGSRTFIKSSVFDRIRTKRELCSKILPFAERAEKDLDLYLEYFCRGGLPSRPNGSGYHLFQKPEQHIRKEGWISVPITPSRIKIADHLLGECAIALKAPWYPLFCAFDVDDPRGDTLTAVNEIIEKLSLNDNQYAVYTSPSYYCNTRFKHIKSFHFYIKPLYNDKPATLRLLFKILYLYILNLGYEFYPDEENAFRLPFGRNQHFIDTQSGYVEDEWSWQDAFQKFDQLTPVALETYPFQTDLELMTRYNHHQDNSLQRREAEHLLDTGLQRIGTRHKVTGFLARYYFFRNFPPEEARIAILSFLEAKHNGMSEEINSGNWGLVNREIDRWVDSTYIHFESRGIYPDSTHNLLGWVTKRDIAQIVQVFPGDYINQKRFFKLLSYFRPHQSKRYVPIHSKKWYRLIGGAKCQEFKKILADKGLLNVNDSYKRGAYSKSYHINRLSSASRRDMLKDENGRAIRSYKTALLKVYGNVRDAAEASGTSANTLYKK